MKVTQKNLDSMSIGEIKIFNDKQMLYNWRLIKKIAHREYVHLCCCETKKELLEYIKKNNIKCK